MSSLTFPLTPEQVSQIDANSTLLIHDKGSILDGLEERTFEAKPQEFFPDSNEVMIRDEANNGLVIFLSFETGTSHLGRWRIHGIS